MHLNYCFYDHQAVDAGDILDRLMALEGALGLASRHFDYLYTLPPGKGDHPGDFKSKTIDLKSLEQGVRTGEIRSFNLSGETDLRSASMHAMYVNSKEHGGTAHISLHLPEVCVDAHAATLVDAFAAAIRPGYGFQCRTDNALKGVGYVLASSLYRNEKGNFSGYLLRNQRIGLPRMIYPVNYLSAAQLDHVVGGTTLRAFIVQRMGQDGLAEVGDALYRMDVGAEDLTDANNAFGEAGFLISWVETRKAKRGLS